MSIKSQKSINDECSDIFERSYSQSSKTDTDDSSSGDDEDENLAKELMNNMTPAVLSKLRRCFKKCKEKTHARDIDSKVEEVMRAAAAEEGIQFAVSSAPTDPLSLDETAFITAINHIFGHHKYSTHAQKLFRVLDPYNAGRAKWKQLVAKLEAVGAKKTGSKRDRWNRVTCNSIEKMEHCKRETIIKLVNIEREDSFCYVVVSKGGRVGIYDGYLKLLNSYEVFYHRTGLRRRVKNCWITDAVYLRDVQHLLLSASDRSLTIYDATTLCHTPLFCITGLPNIPTCVAYSPSSRGGTSELALGSERGDIVRLTFLQPRVQLFHSKAPDTINYYFWMELSSPPHTSNHVITIWRRVHSRAIRRLAYAREGDILLSCSHDSTVSVRARHVPGKLDDYVFKVQRGVSCFHAVYPLHLLATGSVDGCVRLWETSQPSPFATLNAPTLPAVLDVAIVPAREVVLAFCVNCTVHIWDIYEECLLQTLKIKFPFLGVLGHKVEFGAYCIHPGPIYKTMEEEQSEPQPSTSRRTSSVFQAPSGGLILQEDPWQDTSVQHQPLYTRFNRSSLLVTCCAHAGVLWLAPPRGSPPAPPGDTLPPRRPSAWDLPLLADMITPPSASPLPMPPRTLPTPKFLAPAAAEYQVHDLETLLKNAGLQGILAKDFVLMKGLKHDLNRKLAEMEDNKDAMLAAVCEGAPYLSLKMYQPETIDPVDEMTDECRRIMRNYTKSCQIQSVEEFFKFYSESGKHEDRYKPLGDLDYGRFISSRAAKREPALTRQITSLSYKVGRQMLSLAEGMPNEDAFPYTKMTVETRDGGTLVLEGQELGKALQYVPSQGLPSLLSELRSFQQDLHKPPALPRDVLVTNGGQHGIYQCVDLLLEPGDPILTTQYAYTGLHSTLKPYSPEMLELPEDGDGLIPEALDSLLGERLKRALKMPKVLYIIPTGNNPTGTVVPEERRRQIYELACRYDFLILEDDPYMFLNYSGKQVPSFLSLDVCGRVIRLDSISKVISSGLRGGWVTAPKVLLERLELHSQAELLHSCTLAQVLILHLVSNRKTLHSHLHAARELYRRRRDALYAALSEVRELTQCPLPSAGLFFSARVHGVDDVYNMVFHTAFKKGLMLIPGQAFTYASAPCQHIRLTFSKIAYEDMNTAVRHLADIIRNEQRRALEKQPQRLATDR